MIQLQHVRKSFKGQLAVQNLNLQAQEGEILGANGAGKSTTINMLLGFLLPDSGTVSIGRKETAKQATEIRQLDGYIPENVNLHSYLSGLENLDYFCKLAGLKYSKAKLQEFLLTCGLASDAHR